MVILVNLALVWAVFHWGDPASWLVGTLFIALGSACALFLPAGDTRPLRPLAMVQFVSFFIVESVRGGLQVARRALSPQPAPEAGFYRHRPDLPCGTARNLFKDALTLTPGTTFVDKEADILVIHCLELSENQGDAIASLEARVGSIFGPTSSTGAS